MSALILFVFLFGLMALSVPIGYALGASSIIYLFFVQQVPMEIATQRIIVAADSFSLLALPLFILSGNIMSGGGLSRKLITFVDSLIGWVTGGLSVVTVLASMFFGAISGSATATTAAIGSIMIPGMKDKGYDGEFAAAIVAASGLLGAVIPPSLQMISYGTLTGVSVSKMFIGGLIPGILMGLSLIVVSYFICKKNNYVSDEKYSFKRMVVSFKDSILGMMMPIIVLGGIYGGLFTPTEAAVVSVVYTLIVSLFIYREISLKDIPKILLDSAKTSSAIMFLVGTASLFGWALTMGRVPQAVARGIMSISDNPLIVLLLINILLLVIGCFLESIAAIVIIVPILFPLVTQLGIDPLHFGIITCVNIVIGTMTPPFGVCLFVSSGITGLPIEKIAKKAMPFLIVLLLDLLLITYIPAISTFLPKLLG